ncbi:hypothetical protein ACNAW0_09205 [Micromonospora sp. SL1-18]|uniref:hypothetical protein n=1 Tax=Micromonospora sp. SL1-18 TaxID=3399128 RepID=UPI003A4E54C7
MTEHDETLVSGEFAAFRTAYAPAVYPAGPDTVRRTVRRRRRRAALATAVVVAFAVAIPVAANAILGRTGPPSVPAETADPAPSVTAPSPTPSATPSVASPTPGAPDGRISRAQLLAARVDLPSWPSYVPKTCTTDNVRLREPHHDYLPQLQGDLRYGDLDGDGATETVALVACRYGEALAKQVVAFDRDEQERIITMGRVIGTREGMADITDFTVEADGRVRVQVADIQPCCDTPEWWAQKQWRAYTWADTRFVQTAGPTKFASLRLTDLTLTAGDLVLGSADASGRRTGSVSVTVVNKGPVDVPRLGFGNLFTIGERSDGDLSQCRMVPESGSDACLLDGLRAGGNRTYTFRFLIDPGDTGPMSLRVVHFDSQDRYWGDVRPKDNTVDLRAVG